MFLSVGTSVRPSVRGGKRVHSKFGGSNRDGAVPRARNLWLLALIMIQILPSFFDSQIPAHGRRGRGISYAIGGAAK